MRTDRKALRDFLRNHAANLKLLEVPLRIVEPIMEAADRGEYVLNDPILSDINDATRALEVLLKQDGIVRSIQCVSAREPMAQTLQELDAIELASLLEKQFGQRLRKGFVSAAQLDAWRTLYWHAFGNGLRQALSPRFSHATWSTVAHEHFVDPRNQIHEALNTMLFYYLGFAMLGDADVIKKIQPFVDLLPRMVIYAWHRDTSQALALTA